MCALAASAKVLETYKPLSKDTPHKIISSGACGSAAPGLREPSRETSRSVGFNPIAQQVIALLSRSPEALGPGPAKRRRYADPPAGAFLTGLATADWPSLRCGTDALFLFGAKGSALARARVKSRKIRDRPGRSPRPSARTAEPEGLPQPQSACAGRVIPLRPGRPCPCYPGLADGQGCRREVRSAPKPEKEIDHVCQECRDRRGERNRAFHSAQQAQEVPEECPQDAAQRGVD